MDNPTTESNNHNKNRPGNGSKTGIFTKGRKKSLIQWTVLIAGAAILYLTGLHTEVIGTMQRGLLATGIIQPDIPDLEGDFPEAGRDLFFMDEEGSVQSLHDYEGEVIFINIWATWCPPCIAEMPSIQGLYNRFDQEDNVAFLLISVDEKFDTAREFMENRNLEMPVYHYRNRAPGIFESTVIPTTYVVSPDGLLLMEKRGFAKYDTDAFESFLKEASTRFN